MLGLNKKFHRCNVNLVLTILLVTGLLVLIIQNIPLGKENNRVYFQTSPIHMTTAAIETDDGFNWTDIEKKLQDQLRLDKGMGCVMPFQDPFSQESLQFDEERPKVRCSGDGLDWVKCNLSECRVNEDIQDVAEVTCVYRDIMYEGDEQYSFGMPVKKHGSDIYRLKRSDFVKVSCKRYIGRVRTVLSRFDTMYPTRWDGVAAGFRSNVFRVSAPKGRENTLNILIFAFDSTARNGFIRLMPNSYEYLTEKLNATVLKSYNIVGDGTLGAMLPILTGKTELEMPDVRKNLKYTDNNNLLTCDVLPFIFYKLKEDGYRTAYFEDFPRGGTFQFRLNGFRWQPTDHYLRSFLQEADKGRKKGDPRKYCVGDTPQYKVLMKHTNQFFHLDGKKFALTFVSDITHDDFNMINTADDDFVRFMKRFESDGFLQDTMLIVMGDHGPRYSTVRNTLQGKLDERLPLMALVLPPRLRTERPEALQALQHNVDSLTTPHDIYATLLDAMGLKKYWNPYKIPGADLPRGMTLFEPIPRNRSCSEAGIQPHWCACLEWQNVSQSDQLYRRAAQAFVDYINSLTESIRSKCAIRTLSFISWVTKKRLNERVLAFSGTTDGGSVLFGTKTPLKKETYQVKVAVDPAESLFEASMTYLVDEDKFLVDSRDISRTSRYGSEPACIGDTHRHLKPYCYCVERYFNNVTVGRDNK